MAGALRKMGIYLGLVEEDDRQLDDGEFEPRSEREYAAPRPSRERVEHVARGETRHTDSDPYAEEPAVARRRPERSERARVWPATTGATAVDLYPSRSPVAVAEESAYRITTVHPRTYNEARTIGEQFRDGVPVILNLTEMDDSDAKRLVDFAAGLSFGLRGSIERVTNKVFLLSPQNVSVTAEDKARIVEGGFFNQS